MKHVATVAVEPTLASLTGETFQVASSNTSDEARSDISARGFWIRGQTAFAVIRVFNPQAKSHLNQNLPAIHKKNENEKKRIYNKRINNVDHGSFTPLVFSCFGGMSRECSRYYSQAAERIADKRKLPKSIISNWIKTRLNFALLRSCLLCVHGTKSRKNNLSPIAEIDIKVATIEANLKID